MSSRVKIGIIIVIAIVALTGCENLTVGFKYGDTEWNHEFQLKELNNANISVNIKVEDAKAKNTNDAVPTNTNAAPSNDTSATNTNSN